MITRRTLVKQVVAFSAFLRSAIAQGGRGTPEAAAFAQNPTLATKWSLKNGPMQTRWAALVDPAAPLPEYPRPQFVRSEWMNLNGLWEYRPGKPDEAPPFGVTLEGRILVPFAVESAISGVMEHHDRLWYRRTLAVPRTWRGKRVLLHFGAVDYECQVYVNGKMATEHSGGYDPFSCDITTFLSGGDSDELIVRVFDPTEAGGQPRGKQTTKPAGIMYTPTTGIWQTVWLEPVEQVYMERVKIVPDIDAGQLHVTVATISDKAGARVTLKAKSGSQVVATGSGAPGEKISLSIPHARLWTPDDPFLYGLEIELTQAGHAVDRASSYFGMRKSSVGLVDGQHKLLLNNQFVFQAGPLDQGFWPDGIYTPPTDDAIKNDILQMKAMGFNMVRKHIKVEPARWYYWTDTLGLLVWQDMPSANSYLGRNTVPPPEDKAAFQKELGAMVQTLENVPSIVLWTVFNESQGQFDTERMVELVRSVDSSRPVNEASGGTIYGFGDLNDIHNYPLPAVRPSNGRQAMVCGEFGGIGWLIEDHSWNKKGGGYIEITNPMDFLYLYADYMARAQEMRMHRNLSAIVYTQLTDVMTEVNGLMTYDRVLKLPSDMLRKVNEQRFLAPEYKVVMPTSEAGASSWKYVTKEPAGMWKSLDFDDSSWATGSGPFASLGTVGTTWTTPGLWLRRTFNPGDVTEEMLANLVLRETFEAKVEIYINEVGMAPQRLRHNDVGLYQYFALTDALRKAIRPGKPNVIAVHCSGDEKSQHFDAGLAIRIPPPSQVVRSGPAERVTK